MVTFADDQNVGFYLIFRNGNAELLASNSIASFGRDGHGKKDLPVKVLQSVNHLLVVPDYWLGNRTDAFQAHKQSLVAAFIERKLKQDPTVPAEAQDFYDTLMIEGNDNNRELYTYYLQETVAYQLYHQLDALGIAPRRITTPALLWTTRLGESIEGFKEKRAGLIHLDQTGCFLYFFFNGRFIFSRTIELPDAGNEHEQVYNRLNYEINQSFYLYSQKTKNPVEDLFLVDQDQDQDPDTKNRLTEVMGRRIDALPGLSLSSGIGNAQYIPPSCSLFSTKDLMRTDRNAISHKPLKKELYWRPVQWAAIAVGLLLVVLLTAESIYLRSLSVDTKKQMAVMNSADPSGLIIEEATQELEIVRRSLKRPSGSESVLQTFLALPDAVSIEKLSMDLTSTSQMSITAIAHARNPDELKKILRSLLDRLNESFHSQTRPLEEKDVQIILDRSRALKEVPVYRVKLQCGLL